ncbi:MAG: hypothetical protein AB1486_11655 [Planctomycetota bacterium]
MPAAGTVPGGRDCTAAGGEYSTALRCWRSLKADNLIDRAEALQAIVVAADVVGRKHLQPRIFEATRSRRYRSILNRLCAAELSQTFRRAEVIARLPEDEKRVFDNFTQRMKELGAIAPDPEGGPGAYRFTSLLHALYFWMEAERARETKE